MLCGRCILLLLCVLGGAVKASRIQLLATAPDSMRIEAMPKLLEAVKIFFDAQRNASQEEVDLNRTCTTDCLRQIGYNATKDKSELLRKNVMVNLIDKIVGRSSNETILDEEMIKLLVSGNFKEVTKSDNKNKSSIVRNLHGKLMEFVKNGSRTAGLDVDIAYFDQICKLSQPMATCLQDCTIDNQAKMEMDIARSLVEFVCTDRIQTAKTSSNCLKHTLLRRSKFCITKCNRIETKLQESSQIFIISKQSPNLKQGVAKNVCKYTKCIAACFMPTIGSNCGTDTVTITKELVGKALNAFRQAFNLVGEEATVCTMDKANA